MLTPRDIENLEEKLTKQEPESISLEQVVKDAKANPLSDERREELDKIFDEMPDPHTESNILESFPETISPEQVVRDAKSSSLSDEKMKELDEIFDKMPDPSLSPLEKAALDVKANPLSDERREELDKIFDEMPNVKDSLMENLKEVLPNSNVEQSDEIKSESHNLPVNLEKGSDKDIKI